MWPTLFLIVVFLIGVEKFTAMKLVKYHMTAAHIWAQQLLYEVLSYSNKLLFTLFGKRNPFQQES